MWKITKFSILLALLAVPIGCSKSVSAKAPIPPAEKLESSTITKAEGIYKQNCASCHGVDLAGGGGGPDLRTIGSRIAKDDLAKFSKNGTGYMSSVNITEEEANIVGAWLSTKR